MENFAAIDFETANNERTSVCSVGVVIVRDGKIVDSFYSLIQPEPNYYCYWNTKVHGLTQRDTDNAPVFPEVWAQIAPMIEGLPLVAHNKSFDESCLKAVFRCYRQCPKYCVNEKTGFRYNFLYLDSVFKYKNKLVHNQAPIMNRLCPFLLNFHQR